MKGMVFFLLMALLLHTCCSTASNLHPIILIPGNGGNQLEARLTKAYKPPTLFCRLAAATRGGDWFRLWFDPTVLIPSLTRCFADQMMLYYHPEIDDYRNAPGVETRVPYFGSTQGLRYLDPNLKQITGYMSDLVTTLEDLGYVDGVNLFGAPYDFRYGLAGDNHPSLTGTRYLSDLQHLIESAVAANAGLPAILLSHSLGGLFAHRLLTSLPLPWRRRHVARLLALSVPWGGTVQEMLTFASGATLGIPLVNPLLVRGEQRSSESNLWLLPSPLIFKNETLVVGPERSYTARDMAEFLADVGYGEGVKPYNERMAPMVAEGVEDPGVEVTCVVGSGVETPERLRYGRRGGFDVQPEVEYGDGDGTVNMVSLVSPVAEWAAVEVVRLAGVSHTGVLSDGAALTEVVGVVRDANGASLRAVG